MIEAVVAVRVLRPYVVEVTFEDGVRRQVDVEPLLGGEIFRPLRDPDVFGRVTVDRDGGTIGWPNGADLSPEFLYYGDAGPPIGYYDGGADTANSASPAGAKVS